MGKGMENIGACKTAEALVVLEKWPVGPQKMLMHTHHDGGGR